MSNFANVDKKISEIYSFFTPKSVDWRRRFSGDRQTSLTPPTQSPSWLVSDVDAWLVPLNGGNVSWTVLIVLCSTVICCRPQGGGGVSSLSWRRLRRRRRSPNCWLETWRSLNHYHRINPPRRLLEKYMQIDRGKSNSSPHLADLRMCLPGVISHPVWRN